MIQLLRSLRTVLMVTASVAVASCGGSNDSPAPVGQATAASPSIEGTYRLMSRQLPDGTVLKAPQVMGLFTYTKTHRNFNIVGADAGGKFFGSTGATYTFTATQYSQTRFFNIENDASDRTKAAYDSSEKTESAPVKVDGGRIEFQIPGEPLFVFEGTRLTATDKGNFVDVWRESSNCWSIGPPTCVSLA